MDRPYSSTTPLASPGPSQDEEEPDTPVQQAAQQGPHSAVEIVTLGSSSAPPITSPADSALEDSSELRVPTSAQQAPLATMEDGAAPRTPPLGCTPTMRNSESRYIKVAFPQPFRDVASRYSDDTQNSVGNASAMSENFFSCDSDGTSSLPRTPMRGAGRSPKASRRCETEKSATHDVEQDPFGLFLVSRSAYVCRLTSYLTNFIRTHNSRMCLSAALALPTSSQMYGWLLSSDEPRQ